MLNVLLKGSDPTGPREGLRPQGESRPMLGARVALRWMRRRVPALLAHDPLTDGCVSKDWIAPKDTPIVQMKALQVGNHLGWHPVGGAWGQLGHTCCSRDPGGRE